MKKLKKSLAVLLAIIMLASFTPLFASAATALTAARCVLVEAPKLSYKGGEATSNLTVTGGASQADIAIVGGKISYEGTEIEGSFMWTSSATGTPSTTALAVGEIAVRLYFHPTDTTNYSRGIWRSTATAPLEGWPTLYVDGLDATIETAPAVSGDLLKGYALSTLTLSGGVVKDADGNDITSTGKWSFVNATSKPTESGAQEVQWKATGYDTITTTVNVNVVTMEATLVSGPEPRFVRTSAFLFDSADDIYIKDGSGKVVDKDGNDITANGTWTAVVNMSDTIIMKDTEVDVKWTATGYTDVYAKMVVTVGTQYASNLKLKANPSFDIPVISMPYEQNKTYADVAKLIPGEITDESGNKIDGTWTYTIAGYYSQAPDQVQITIGTKSLSPKFIPADTTLPEITGFVVSNNRVTVTKTDFTIIEDFEIVLNYGAFFDGSLSGSDLKFSTVGTVPAQAGIKNIIWDKNVFDPQTADYGTVTYVEAKIRPEFANIYNEQTFTIPVRIQPYTIAGIFTSASNMGDYSSGEDNRKGIISYAVDFTNTRLFGSVTITVTDGTNEWTVDTVESVLNEDGVSVFEKRGTWQAPCDGEYWFTYTYNPSEADTAVAERNVYNRAEPVVVDMMEKRTVTIKVGTDVTTETIYESLYYSTYWAHLTKTSVDSFDHWEFTDGEGNAFTPQGVDIYDENISFVVPEHDVIAIAVTESGEAVEDEATGLWGFWQKLINFIVEIYRTIVDFLIPTVETF